MNFIVSLIFILSALISAGYSISCISCTNTAGDTCSGSSITCPTEANSCASIYTKATILKYGVTVNSLSRGCGYAAECAQPTRNLSNSILSEEIFISCCQSDDCTPSLPKGDTPYSISCVSCTNTTGDTCDGPSITCPPEADRCASIYTNTKLFAYGKTVNSLVRGCGFSAECAQPTRSLSNQYMSVETLTKCCRSAGCMPCIPKVQISSPIQNGVACPSCFSLTTKCVPQGFTQCTGTENKCISYSTYTLIGEHSMPVFSMSGCATENLCTNYNGNVSSSAGGEMISISCTNNTTSSTSSPSTVTRSYKTTSGNSLSCVSCSSVTGDTCDGPTVTCPLYSDICTSTYTTTKEYGMTVKTLVRGCGYSAVCAQPVKSFSSHFKSEYSFTSCCQGNGCTPNQPAASTEVQSPNGLICDICFPQTSKCVPNVQIFCRGSENKCISYSKDTSTGGQPVADTISGCATENYCSDSISISTSNTNTEINLSCKRAVPLHNSGRKSTQAYGTSRVTVILLLNVFAFTYSLY